MRLLKIMGTALLFLLTALCLAPSLVPPFLDRIYYRGEPSGHFNGERFFNPGFGEYRASPQRFMSRFLAGERAQWPAQVPVTPSRPPQQVEGDRMLVTWIGHATVLVQTQGLNILTDPIWSERASPFSFVGPRRVRQPGVRFQDLPKIDLVVISHNHYDHMDLPTLERLWARDRPMIVTSLGNDAILRSRGIEALALDWSHSATITADSIEADEGVPRCDPYAACPGDRAQVIVERNHHWGSRWGTDRNRALWSAFTVRLPGGNIFFAGDTGWGDGSWVREAARNGPFRLAIIPIGAYEPRDFMRNNHINPEEAVRIFELLAPTRALGVHWGTFQLTFEGINEPWQRLAEVRRARRIPPDRFIATEVGRSFDVPPLGR